MPRFVNWLSSYWELFQRGAVISTMPEAYEWIYGDAAQTVADSAVQPPDDGLPVMAAETSDDGASRAVE